MEINCGEFFSDLVFDYFLFVGRWEIGCGESIIVFDGDVVDGQECVFKVFFLFIDYVYYMVLDWLIGKYFFVVYVDYGIVGWFSCGFLFYIVEVEKFYLFFGDGDVVEVVIKLSVLYFDVCLMWCNLVQDMGCIVLYYLVVMLMGWSDVVQYLLKVLEGFLDEYGVLFDFIKVDNLMMCKDGMLVFFDLVFMEQLCLLVKFVLFCGYGLKCWLLMCIWW